jgi:transposase-like protein
LGVHPSQLRDWVKKFADDPQYAFPGHGQMKPEQLTGPSGAFSIMFAHGGSGQL